MPMHSSVKGMVVTVKIVSTTEICRKLEADEAKLKLKKEEWLFGRRCSRNRTASNTPSLWINSAASKYVQEASAEAVIGVSSQAVHVGKRVENLRRKDSRSVSSTRVCEPPSCRWYEFRLTFQYLYRFTVKKRLQLTVRIVLCKGMTVRNTSRLIGRNRKSWRISSCLQTSKR